MPHTIEERKERFSAMFGPYVYELKVLYGNAWTSKLEEWRQRLSEKSKRNIYLYRHYKEFNLWKELDDDCPFD